MPKVELKVQKKGEKTKCIVLDKDVLFVLDGLKTIVLSGDIKREVDIKMHGGKSYFSLKQKDSINIDDKIELKHVKKNRFKLTNLSKTNNIKLMVKLYQKQSLLNKTCEGVIMCENPRTKNEKGLCYLSELNEKTNIDSWDFFIVNRERKTKLKLEEL